MIIPSLSKQLLSSGKAAAFFISITKNVGRRKMINELLSSYRKALRSSVPEGF